MSSPVFAARQTLCFGAEFIPRSDVKADHKTAALYAVVGV